MGWGGPTFVIVLVAISTFGWLVNNWIRARHGYAVEDEWGGKTERADRAMTALRQENEQLSARLEAFEDRVIVLERVVTDRGFDVAAQIEALRDTRKVDARLDDRSKV